MKPKILVARAIFPDVIERLAQYFDVERNDADTVFSSDELRARLADKAGAITTASERIDASVLAGAPNLRVVANMAVGYNNFDIEAMTAAGVMATNTPDVLNETTADFGWALLMATARRVTESERWLREGHWDKWAYDMFLGADVHGSTLGIVGMGRIGGAVARRAALGFGMKVLYSNRSRNEAAEKAYGAEHRTLPELLAQSDFVVTLVPLSPATERLIGAKEFAQMKRGAIFINAARGKVIDEAALVDALASGHLRAAGLDVFEREPVSVDSPLLKMKHVVALPHIGSATHETRHAMASCAADNLIAALTGKPLQNVVNP